MPFGASPACNLCCGATTTKPSLLLLPVAMATTKNLLCSLAMIPFMITCMYYSEPEVHEVSFWLMKYGAPSPKRLLLKSNWHHISKLDLGRLPHEERMRLTTIKTSCSETQMGLLDTILIPACMPKVVKENHGVEQRLCEKPSQDLKSVKYNACMPIYIGLISGPTLLLLERA